MGQPAAAGDGFEKLQEFLLALSPGDEVSVSRATEISGLDRAYCDRVLTALMQAGLMLRLRHDAFVRCRLLDNGGQPRWPSPPPSTSSGSD